MDLLDDIPDSPSYDREYINKLFAVVVADKYLIKQIGKGLGREQVLANLRETKRYTTMTGNENNFTVYMLIILHYDEKYYITKVSIF